MSQYRLIPRLRPLLGEREGTYDEKFEGGESDDELGDDEDVKGVVTSSVTYYRRVRLMSRLERFGSGLVSNFAEL